MPEKKAEAKPAPKRVKNPNPQPAGESAKPRVKRDKK